MVARRQVLAGGALAVAAGVLPWWLRSGSSGSAGSDRDSGDFPFTLTDEQWRARLTATQYDVLRRHGTEHPYTSDLLDEHRDGVFSCAGCDHPLFSSGTKFDSRTGWPSFWEPLPGAVGTAEDRSLGMVRTEVHCANCGGHQGHVFEDGPPPTGERWCINGVALAFTPAVG